MLALSTEDEGSSLINVSKLLRQKCELLAKRSLILISHLARLGSFFLSESAPVERGEIREGSIVHAWCIVWVGVGGGGERRGWSGTVLSLLI